MLHIVRRQVVVVVEPDLPHRAHAAVAQTLAQGGLKLRRPVLGVVRVHAGRDAHMGHRRGSDNASRPVVLFFHDLQIARGFHEPEGQHLEGGEAVLGRIDDGLHEGDAVGAGAGQLAGRVSEHLQVRMGIGHGPFQHRRGHHAPLPALALLTEQRIVKRRILLSHDSF